MARTQTTPSATEDEAKNTLKEGESLMEGQSTTDTKRDTQEGLVTTENPGNQTQETQAPETKIVVIAGLNDAIQPINLESQAGNDVDKFLEEQKATEVDRLCGLVDGRIIGIIQKDEGELMRYGLQVLLEHGQSQPLKLDVWIQANHYNSAKGFLNIQETN